jgi:hypothetical protein
MDGIELYQALFDRLLCLAVVGYVYLMLTAALTAFQRFCQCWIVLHSQDARRARASADSCRDRANTWTERSMVEPDGLTRADFARRAAWFASRAEAHEARARHHDLEVLINRFLQ